eukprot:6806398-Pyramimonas_sp.AAC.1
MHQTASPNTTCRTYGCCGRRKDNEDRSRRAHQFTWRLGACIDHSSVVNGVRCFFAACAWLLSVLLYCLPSKDEMWDA